MTNPSPLEEAARLAKDATPEAMMAEPAPTYSEAIEIMKANGRKWFASGKPIEELTDAFADTGMIVAAKTGYAEAAAQSNERNA
ncbi:MAG: hypothetical protein AAF141_13865 [Pseudomonadota bacterium]